MENLDRTRKLYFKPFSFD